MKHRTTTPAMTFDGERRASTLWIVLLTIASTVTTLAFACATPFTALAAIAATQMRARDGVALMLLVWLASQAVGFCVLGYPHDVSTIAWGAALGLAAVAALVAARGALGFAQARSEAGRLATAFIAASIAFKLVIIAGGVVIGVSEASSSVVEARQLVQGSAILIVLMAIYRTLVAIGLPAAPRDAQAVPA